MKNRLNKELRNPLFWLALALFLTTFFFIGKQVWEMGLTGFLAPLSNLFFYCLFALIFGLWVYCSGRKSPEQLISRTHLTRTALYFLPATLTLLYGVSFSNEFHFLFQIGAGLALIATLSLLFWQKGKVLPRPKESVTFTGWFRLQGFPALLAVLFFTGFFFSFATYRLGQYAAVDEPLWLYGRITKFWNNVQEREWEKTDVSDKPGITVALISGAGLLSYDPEHFDDQRHQGEVFIAKDKDMEAFFFAFRFPIVIVITLLLFLTYFLLERSVGRNAALLSYAALTTSPILIGVAKIINPDALLWVFTTLSLLSYLAFQKRAWPRYLILAGFFLGLALLTKYIANILFIYLLALFFLEYLYHPAHSKKAISVYLQESFFRIGLVAFTALATFYLLLPANWLHPYELIEATLLSQAFVKVAPLFVVLVALLLVDHLGNKGRAVSFVFLRLQAWREVLSRAITAIFFGAIVFTLGNTWAGMKPYHFMELIASPKTIEKRGDLIGIFLTNFYPLVFSLIPLALVLTVAGLLFLFRKNFFQDDRARLLFYTTVFTLVYYLGATVNGVGSILRYQIIIFPLVALAAGMGASLAVSFLEKRFPQKRTIFLPLFLGIWAVAGAYTLLQTPFPLSYASSLLPKQYYVDLKDMGPGSYEMAMLLNALPEAEKTLIWTDKDGVCQFFVGRCKRGNGKAAITDQDIDYIVISSARESRTTNMIKTRYEAEPRSVIPLHLFYEKTEPADFSVFINDRPSHYVKAYRYHGQPEKER